MSPGRKPAAGQYWRDAGSRPVPDSLACGEIPASALDYSAATLAIIPANAGGRMMFWPRG
jgi:hypothetical protein